MNIQITARPRSLFTNRNPSGTGVLNSKADLRDLCQSEARKKVLGFCLKCPENMNGFRRNEYWVGDGKGGKVGYVQKDARVEGYCDYCGYALFYSLEYEFDNQDVARGRGRRMISGRSEKPRGRKKK